MVTQEVIKEIYKHYSKPPKDMSDLRLPYFLDMLKTNHNLAIAGDEIINRNLDEFNPFRRFLTRRLTAILEFEKVVAFVFNRHIIFFDKNSPNMHIHFKPEKQSFLSRLFGRK